MSSPPVPILCVQHVFLAPPGSRCVQVKKMQLNAHTYVLVPVEAGAGADTCWNGGWCTEDRADKWTLWTLASGRTRTLERSPLAPMGVRTLGDDGGAIKCLSMLRVDADEAIELMKAEAPMVTVTFESPVTVVESKRRSTCFVDASGATVAVLRPVATWRNWYLS